MTTEEKLKALELAISQISLIDSDIIQVGEIIDRGIRGTSPPSVRGITNRILRS